MTKTIYRTEYAALLGLLKRYRAASGLTQLQCSQALGKPQSFMSDVEKGTRRIDVIQLRDLCGIFGLSLGTAVQDLEELLKEEE
ncbi:helix-turn-helix domain-containing protein [Pseudomonas alabamensis]|uniref:helix-turn-helix domain-containing protein n=1 Tax=Pseudomonas alabamensis TaxID=3064349 RepID=UPI003F64C511